MYSTDKLRKIRKEHGYTIYKMAEILGITPSFYSQIENKKRRLFYDTACAIAEIFNMKPDEIFFEKKENDELQN